MNMTRKFASLLLAMILVLCAVTPAMADQEGNLTGGSITIDNAVKDQKYDLYQLLYLESYNVEAKAYAYKANSEWKTWLKTQTTYVTIDDQGYVTWVEGADAVEFAKAAQAYAKSNSITADKSETANTTTVEFTDLKLGYYMVDSTLGVLCSLDTTNPNVMMKEKNAAPTNEKTVEEDSDGVYGETNDADIGQTVNFKSNITAQAGAENYVFHDTMSKGLTYNKDAKVYTDEAMTQELDSANYTVNNSLDNGETFNITFKQDYLNTINMETKLYVKYSAILNKDAVVGLPGNPNSSQLSYGDSNNITSGSNITPPSETITYTWDLDILKYANGNENSVLKDAKFVLLNKDRDKVAVIENGKLTGWADVPAAGTDDPSTWPANTVLTTDDGGKIEIDGLDADTYYLREIKAPDGYNKLAEDVEVKITGATKAEGSNTLNYTTVVTKVNNQSGTELPSTGGMGTTLFYVVGGVLVVAAFVLLVTKRRVGAEK